MFCLVAVILFGVIGSLPLSSHATETEFLLRKDGAFTGIHDAVSGSVVDLTDSKYVLDSYILPKKDQDRYVRIDTTDLNSDDKRIAAVIGKADQSFHEHLSLHPGNKDAYVILDISDLNCNRFYSAVGISAEVGKKKDKGVVFTVHGYSESKELFEPIATSGDLYGYDSGEFYVDITGYKQLKLTVSLTADSTDYNSRTASWCNVSVYNSTASSGGQEDTSIQIPEFTSSSGIALEPHYCGHDNFELVYKAVNTSIYADMDAYETKLQAAGYTLYTRNNIGNNRIFTYINGSIMIHCIYLDTMKYFRIIYGPQTYLAATEPVTDHKKLVTPSVTVIGMTDSELSLVFQLEDGSFVIIDGGNADDSKHTVILNENTPQEYTFEVNRSVETNMTTLWNFLKDNTPDGGRPQITWMITHADGDHVGLPQVFIEKYGSKFDLNTVVYNFPNFHNIGLHADYNPESYTKTVERFLNAVNTHFPNANHFIYHTGMKMYLPGCEIEFLYTHEDYWPFELTSCNHTSGIWRFRIEGKTVMITGDCSSGPNGSAAQNFGNYLKSDVLQVVHHGANGGNMSFNQNVAPSVCLWACTDQHFQYDLRRTGQLVGWEFNKYLRENAEAHYSGSTTTTLRFPSLEVRPELNGPDYAPEEPSEPVETTAPTFESQVPAESSTPTVENDAPAPDSTAPESGIIIGIVTLCAVVIAVAWILRCKRK